MKPLRNFLLLSSYFIGLLGIGVMIWTSSKIIWIPILAILLVVIAYFLLKTERRHSRIPFIIGILGLILAFCMPILFPPEINVEENFIEEVDDVTQEMLEDFNKDVEENNDITLDEPIDNGLPDDLDNENLVDNPTEIKSTPSVSTEKPTKIDEGEMMAPLEIIE